MWAEPSEVFIPARQLIRRLLGVRRKYVKVTVIHRPLQLQRQETSSANQWCFCVGSFITSSLLDCLCQSRSLSWPCGHLNAHNDTSHLSLQWRQKFVVSQTLPVEALKPPTKQTHQKRKSHLDLRLRVLSYLHRLKKLFQNTEHFPLAQLVLGICDPAIAFWCWAKQASQHQRGERVLARFQSYPGAVCLQRKCNPFFLRGRERGRSRQSRQFIGI